MSSKSPRNGSAVKSWLNYLFFGDANRLVKAARTRILQETDLLDLPEKLNPRQSSLDLNKVDWTEGPRLVWSLLWSARRRLRWPYLFYILSTLISLTQPVLVNRFVGTISGGLADEKAFHFALAVAGLLGISSIFRGIFMQHYFFGTLQTFQLFINAINERLFRHALKMSGRARIKTPIGDVVNHMSSDSETVADFSMLIADIIYTVIMILGVVGLLFYYIGWSAIVPLVLLTTLVPGTNWLAKRFTHLEEAMMHERDRRVTLMGQILNAIRVVKYFAWEKSVIKEVSDVRNREILARRRMGRGAAFSSVTYVAVSSIVLFAALAVHAYRGFPLDPALVFTCVSLFSLLEEPFGGLSWLISRTMNAFVGAKRVTAFLSTETLSERPELPFSSDAALALQANELTSFGGTSLNIRAGESVALVGPVGCGKSTLLSVLLGEQPEDRGRVKFVDAQGVEFEARTAFVSQEAYIVNGSLLENLSFGVGDVDPLTLQRAIEDSSLERDIQELPAGLLTEIGEKGVNLSGGQKQRVSLARAALQNPQIVFLDDPLSAVDVETEEKLCDRLLFGRWGQITRVVATHRLESLRRFDRILFLEHGKIQDQGTYDQLLKSSPRFTAFVRDHERTQGQTGEAAALETPTVVATSVAESRITDDEEREVGAVKGSVYLDYFRSLGGEGTARRWRLTLLLLGAISVMGLPLLQRWWLGLTSSYQQDGKAEGLAAYLISEGWEFWLKDPLASVLIYGVIGLLALAVSLGNSLWWLERGIEAGRLLQEKMLRSLMKANIRFFDSTPIGRILQRFSRDVESVDLYLQQSFDGAIHILIEILLCLVLILSVVPMSAVVVAPVMVLYYFIQRDYRRPAREVKRLDSIARSPRYAHFKETLMGLPVIRGFKREEWFLQSFYDKLAHSQRMFYSHYLLNRWFSARVPLIGGLISIATAVAIVLSARSGYINAGIAGVLTIYMLSFWGYLNWGIRVFADIESRMTSVERLQVYANLPAEKDQFRARTTELPADWPRTGELRVEKLQARYASHLPLVLKGISFEVKAGQRVGIIGRTGSGKSTLFQCLFRFVELEGGAIYLDGEDISTVPLERLRRNLAIIPQDPALFMGTIRSNLDRYSEHTNEAIEQALRKASMWNFVSKLPGQLEFAVAENGLNLSQGQRQLLCLARALLSKARLIVLDEATASVDVETDAILQKVIRESLEGVTMLIIAHRLGTVMDSDKVIELSGGLLKAEFKPREMKVPLAELISELEDDESTSTGPKS